MDALYIDHKPFERNGRRSLALTLAFDTGNGMATGTMWINSNSPVYSLIMKTEIKPGQKINIDIGLDYRMNPVIRSVRL